MLVKVGKVKNLGVFADYTWGAQLSSFERFNVIYGDNGSGKTTFSRLLDCLKTGSHDEYPTLEYRIESQSGDLVHGQPAARKIRVFNADYVQLNIGPMDSPLKPILVIGEENKALADELVAEQTEVATRKGVISAATEAIRSLQNGRGKIFTAIAKTISEATSGSTVRNYRKNNAEIAFQKLEADVTLSAEELETRRATLRQEPMEVVALPKALVVRINDVDVPIADAMQVLIEEASSLCGRSAVSAAIQRLRDNPDIAGWVEQGHAHHKKHGSTDCEFCGQPVPADRWAQLEAHFSTEDQALKTAIEACKASIEAAVASVRAVALPDKLAFYSDLRDRYDTAQTAWRDALEQTERQCHAVCGRLAEKLLARAESMSFELQVDLTAVLEAHSALAAVIQDQNAKTDGFDKACENARAEIEKHYLTSVKSDVAEFDAKIQAQEALIRSATDGSQVDGTPTLEALEASIMEKRAQISNAHKAGDRLTKLLHTFLGRSDLVFNSTEEGYRVVRNGRAAKRLSEGERTAIAFIYFIVQLEDQDFDLANGVVVIDDPVSSLDASAVYQAFSFLKNAVKDAKQVFILTHNFSFLRLLINWLQNVPKSEGKKAYFMLVCRSDTAGRKSSLTKLDKALIDHPTEYHFLFKVLAQFENDGTIAGCYHIPNVVRKVLETFLDFHAPAPQTLHAKLNSIRFDEAKKTAIYKFSNDLSHRTGQGFEPGLVQESQKNAAYLLEMIKELAPAHYDGMMASIT